MTGDVVRDFAGALAWLVTVYKVIGWLIGLCFGFFGVLALNRYREEAESWELYAVLAFLALLMGPVVHFGVPLLVAAHFKAVIPFPYLLLWLGGAVSGAWFGFVFLRVWVPRLILWREARTKRTEAERDRKTDVRTVHEQMPATPEFYDVMRFYEPDSVVFGLDQQGSPVRVPYKVWKSNHVQLAGTTGAGKGVAAQMLLAQAVRHGEAVFVMDPKNDEWLPHVLHAVAKAEGVPYHFIDLRDGTPAQINPLIGTDRAGMLELFLAAFGLSEKGGDADFYRSYDRKAARYAAAAMAEMETPSFAGFLNQLHQLPGVKDAPGFVLNFEEMAELDSINADRVGVDFAEVIAKGGVVYIVGSMRNDPVKRAQRLLMVRLIQLAEERDRLKEQRPVCVFLDEVKYHLSRPAMEIFCAARDKGLHAIVAHQSLVDLRDVPGDLDPDAVAGSVIENTALKLIYRIQDPETAEWLAKRSGTKLVDAESRTVSRNIAQSEILSDERTLRLDETYLIDTNMMQNLPERVAVVFGPALPTLVGTSPILAKKSPDAIAIAGASWDDEPETEIFSHAKKSTESPSPLEEIRFLDE